MKKPKVYFVNGTVAACDGQHLFKNTVCKFGLDISELKAIADVQELSVDNEGVYYLQDEGTGIDYGERYLIASGGIAVRGCCGNGSIGSILSPVRAYNDYLANTQDIKELLNKTTDDVQLNRNYIRLLFIGVCGEFEGYLYTTIASLIQGCRDVFLLLRESEGLQSNSSDEQQWRNDIVNKINNKFLFQHICNKDSKERKIYEKLLGEPLIISQELIDYKEWRNKLAHKVPFYKKLVCPSKEDVLNFIKETDKVVYFIDYKIENFKSEWFTEF